MPRSSATIWAVSLARDRGELTMTSQSVPASTSTASRACWRPVSFNGMSLEPCMRPSAFQSVWPWRMKAIVILSLSPSSGKTSAARVQHAQPAVAVGVQVERDGAIPSDHGGLLVEQVDEPGVTVRLVNSQGNRDRLGREVVQCDH